MRNFLQNSMSLFALTMLCAGCTSGFSPYSNLSQSSLSSSPYNPANPQMQLTWKANRGEQQGFYIEQSTDGKTYSQIQIVPDGVSSTKVSVVKGQKYYFRVRGYNQVGPSPYSSIVMGSL